MSILTVSALNTHIVALFEQDDVLRDVAVVGEVSNWKRASSGHAYFNLKDAGANLAAVMWRGNVMGQNWLPRDGDQIVAYGYVGVYPERGVYQLYTNRILPAGRGQLYARYEELKEKLAAAGLFAPERKRPLPVRVRRVGVITSRDAAALRDILRVISVRWPLVEVVVFSTPVQGADAPTKIAEAVACANRYSCEVEPLEVLILARGGGSIEDLWCFNDEDVAYAVAGSQLPVVTGVGHETDFTIVDFVADVRAPTPSAAAMAVVPDRAEALLRMRGTVQWMAQRLEETLEHERQHIDDVTNRLRRAHPQRQLDRHRQSLDDRERRLHWAVRRRLDRLGERTLGARHRLEALNPLAVLQRGYSVVQRQTGEVVTQPDVLVAGELLQVRAAEGAYQVQVTSATGTSKNGHEWRADARIGRTAREDC